LNHLSYALLLFIFIEAINFKALALFYHLHTQGRAWVTCMIFIVY
jgi:hypothetical protein